MYYYEKDYIMRLIHGVAQILAKLLFNRQEEVEIPAVMEENCRKDDDLLKRMVDEGRGDGDAGIPETVENAGTVLQFRPG